MTLEVDMSIQKSWAWIVLLLSISSPVFSGFCIYEEAFEPYTFEVYKKSYAFSTYFEMVEEGISSGTVVKQSFSLHSCYDCYDREGIYQGTGICRIFSLGFLFAWATEIDIYDNEGYFVGFIDGKILTTTKARFGFYDSTGRLSAIAYADNDLTGYSLVDPDNAYHAIAALTRFFVPDLPDPWSVSVYEPEVMDPLMIQIFAAFSVDRQGAFRPDE